MTILQVGQEVQLLVDHDALCSAFWRSYHIDLHLQDAQGRDRYRLGSNFLESWRDLTLIRPKRGTKWILALGERGKTYLFVITQVFNSYGGNEIKTR